MKHALVNSTIHYIQGTLLNLFILRQCVLAMSTGTTVMMGTCYTESECSANGGRASGNCASGTYHLFQGPMLWRLFASGKFESFDKVQTQYLWPSLLCHFRSFQFYNFTLLFCQDLEFAVFSGLLIFCLVNISKL